MTSDYVLVADRDALDTQDIFRCLRAGTGEELWSVRVLAQGQLDFGNAPRATPQIAGDFVFFYNAFGQLLCVRLDTGETVWKKNLIAEFGAQGEHNAWGSTSSPLVLGDQLIVNPGGSEASIVALKVKTGEVIWKTPGSAAAFGSLIVGQFGGHREIVGHDKYALCGWDVNSGQRLWRLVPPRSDDFNVPTPIIVERPGKGNQLIVCTENNGTNLYRFDDAGQIVPEPVAVNRELAPDTHTPVLVGNRLVGVWQGLYCLEVPRKSPTGIHDGSSDSLRMVWKADDPAFDDYATVIGSGNCALIVSKHGELLLVDSAADQYRLISRLTVFDDDPGVYSHPAMVGTRLYLRGSDEIVCLELADTPVR